MLGAILLIFLVLILVGGLGGWIGGPWYGAPANYHPFFGGGVGLILVIVVILILFGRV